MSKSIYPSIPAPGTDTASLRTSVDAMRQTLTMLIMNSQKPNPNFTPSSASQIFLTRADFTKSGVIGAQGPMGPAGPAGESGVEEAPYDANTYGRHDGEWVPITSGGGGTGGIAEAPIDGTAYGRMNASWVNVVPTTGGVVDGGNF